MAQTYHRKREESRDAHPNIRTGSDSDRVNSPLKAILGRLFLYHDLYGKPTRVATAPGSDVPVGCLLTQKFDSV